MLWENLREEEFNKAITDSCGICILPMGCLEKHGQHLPVGTDYFEAMGIVKEAAERECSVVFPSGAWLGEVSCFHAFEKPEENNYRGCIGIKQQTILTVLDELCSEIARNGFKKILIVNGHGGNTVLLKHFLRCLSYERRDYEVFVTSAFAFSDIAPKRLINTVRQRRKDFPYLTEADISTLTGFAESGTGGGHADIRETCLVMEHDESLVCPEKYTAESGQSTHKNDCLTEAGIEGVNFWLENFPNSYEALPPHGASASIGRVMKEICVERIMNIIKILKEKQ